MGMIAKIRPLETCALYRVSHGGVTPEIFKYPSKAEFEHCAVVVGFFLFKLYSLNPIWGQAPHWCASLSLCEAVLIESSRGSVPLVLH